MAVSVTVKMREHTASVTRDHKFLSGNRGSLCVEQLRQYASSPRKDKSRYEKRGYKELLRARAALLVWPAHQPRCSPGEKSVRGSIVA